MVSMGFERIFRVLGVLDVGVENTSAIQRAQTGRALADFFELTSRAEPNESGAVLNYHEQQPTKEPVGHMCAFHWRRGFPRLGSGGKESP